MSKILFIDNFDSFTYNLVEYVREHAETEVLLNNVTLEEVRGADPDGIVISPGPGHPANEDDVGVTLDVLRELSPDVPTLGVCLGLEAAVYAYGGTIEHAPEPIHGKAFDIHHNGEGIFAGIGDPISGGRYHSLIAATIPDCFEVTAWTSHGEETLVMGVEHEECPITCIQFHPESILTSCGHDIVENFVRSVDERTAVPP
jgi:anthranilate synthase component 2